MECLTLPSGSALGNDDRHSGGDGGEANGGGGLKPNAVSFTPSLIHSAPENLLKSHLPVLPNPLRSDLAFQSLPIAVPSPENEHIESLNPPEEQFFDMKSTCPDGGATHRNTSELLQSILKPHCSRKASVFQFKVDINLDKLPKDTKLRRSIFQWVVEELGDKVALAYLDGKITPSFIHFAPGNVLMSHPPVPPNPLKSDMAFQSLPIAVQSPILQQLENERTLAESSLLRNMRDLFTSSSTPFQTPNPDSKLLANILLAQCSPGATILQFEIDVDQGKVPKDRELRRSLFQLAVDEIRDTIALAYRDGANMKSDVCGKLTLDGKINLVVPDVAPGTNEELYEFHEESKTELLDNPQDLLGKALIFKINQRNARITARETFGYDLLGQIIAKLPLKQAFRLRCINRDWNDIVHRGDFIKEQVNAASENPTFSIVLHSQQRNTLRVYSRFHSQFPPGAGTISTGKGVVVIGSCDGIVATVFQLLGQNRTLVCWNPFTKWTRVILSQMDSQYSIRFGKQDDVFNFVKVVPRLNLPCLLYVYSSNNNSWDQQNVDMEFILQEKVCDVIVNRKPYWRARSGEDNFILRFDWEVNRFTRIDYPLMVAPLGNFVNNKLIQYGRRMAFIDFEHNQPPNLYVDIWEHTGQGWVSRLVLFNLQNVPFWLTPQGELLYRQNNGILTHQQDNQNIPIDISTPVVLNHWSTLTSF